MTTKLKLLFASLAFAGITTLSAQTVGYVTRSMTAGTANVFSIPFDQPPATFTGSSSGALEAVGATSLTDNEGGWATNFSTAATPYFIKITSGTGTGLYFQIATTNTSSVLTLAAGEKNPVTLGVVAGDTYKILAGYTLKSFFTGVAVNQGANSASADQVFLINNGSWDGPNFRNTSGVWKRGISTTDNTVIRPETGIYFYRQNLNGALTITVSGTVPDENLLYQVPNATTNLVNTVFPVDTTMLNSGIQNTAGWTANTDAVFLLANGTWTRYTWNGTQWKKGIANGNTDVIGAGQPVLIQKNSGTGGTTSAYSKTKPY